MLETFDLWAPDDVRQHAGDILEVLEGGSMPCDGPWPPEQVETFRGWVEAGTPP